MPNARTLFVSIAALALAAPGAVNSVAATATPARRELTTDRPDATESPFTIEPGHMQLEMDFANYTRHRESGVRHQAWEVVPFNLRFGLAPDLEAGFFMVPFHGESLAPPAGPGLKRNGFGDVTLRTKLNLWGNDGGKSAFGAIGDLKLPTASGQLGKGKFEGAMTFPLALTLDGGWSCGAMTSVAMVHDGSGYQAVWDNTITVGHELAKDLGGFVELTSSTGEGTHAMTLNLGVTHALGPNAQLDAGINIGVSRRAPDLQLFVGMARRF